MGPGYRESELISNRVSVLLHGGLEEERRQWAEEAASFFSEEGLLREVRAAADLTQALATPGGVVYVPDVLKLGWEAQGALVRCLALQEERPKLVLGVVGNLQSALDKGNLRDDLHYRLHRSVVDLAGEGVRESIARRRKERPVPKPESKGAARQATGTTGRRPLPAKSGRK